MVSSLFQSSPKWLPLTACSQSLSAVLTTRSVFPESCLRNRQKFKHQACEKPRLCYSPVIPFFPLEMWLVLKISLPKWFPHGDVVGLRGPSPAVEKAQARTTAVATAAGRQAAKRLDWSLTVPQYTREREKRPQYVYLISHTHTHKTLFKKDKEWKKIQAFTKPKLNKQNTKFCKQQLELSC